MSSALAASDNALVVAAGDAPVGSVLDVHLYPTGASPQVQFTDLSTNATVTCGSARFDGQLKQVGRNLDHVVTFVNRDHIRVKMSLKLKTGVPSQNPISIVRSH